MIKQFIKGKTFVFIDASNIYHSQKKLKWKIAFLRLREYFKDNMELCKIYYMFCVICQKVFLKFFLKKD